MHILEKIYHHLFKMYGQQYWWPAKTHFEVMVGAILTQNTSWTNVEKAIFNLRKHKLLTATKIAHANTNELAELLKPAGYFNVKAKRLQSYCRWFLAQGGYKQLNKLTTEKLREALLNVHGVGAETADDILLYAFHRPVFVIDAYTRRLLTRLKIIKGNESYETLRSLMETALTVDVALFNEYHALIVVHAKTRCRKTKPVCTNCNLKKLCHFNLA